MPGRGTWDVQPGAPMVPDPPASILHLPCRPALPALLNLPFSPHFEVSAHFVPLGRADAWAASSSSDYSQTWGICRPVCQATAFASGRAGKEPGEPGRMGTEARLCLGAILSVLLQAGKHQRDREPLSWAPGAVNNEGGIHK